MAHGNDSSARLAKRPLQRRDAAENRDRLLNAARKVFAAQGPNAPFDDIARAAGVSRTTLYRNFATREELAAAVYEDNVLLHEEQARAVLGQPDGIVTLYNQVLESAVRHRGFTQILSGNDTEWFADLGARVVAQFALLIEDGREAGIVRPGIGIEDIMITFQMADNAVLDQLADEVAKTNDRIARLLRSALFDMSRVRISDDSAETPTH